MHAGSEDYPIQVTVIGDKARVLHPAAKIDGNGELVPWRRERIVQFYSDLGMRTVKLDELRIR